MAAASGRTVSFSITSAAGRSDGGSSPFCGRPSARASTSTREPSPAASATRPLAASPAPIRTSAPPTNHDPCSPNDTALHFRAEENGTDAVDDPAARRRGEPVADRGHRRVRVLVGGRDRRERVVHARFPVERLDRDDRELARRERPRLVDAEHVDAREPLDGRQLLHEHVALREPEDGDGERQAHQQDEPFRHHGHRARDRAANRHAPAVVVPQLAHEQQRRRRHDRDRHPPQDLVDAVAELRVG